jgi:hypothetical protein
MPSYALFDDYFLFTVCGLFCATTSPSASQRSG